MSSKEQELKTTKYDDDKPDSSLQTTTTPVEPIPSNTPEDNGGDTNEGKVDDSKLVAEAFPEDCGDSSKQITCNESKAADLNKFSEFDDDDDFNSDEMQLRWDDDDEPINDEKCYGKKEDDLISKDSDTENPSTSLVSAVKELENALIETTSSCKDANDTLCNNELKEGEGNISNEILDDIDKLIGNDVVDKSANNVSTQPVNESVPAAVEKTNEDVEISIDLSSETEESHKIDEKSVSSSKDSVTKELVKSEKPADNIGLDESGESLEVLSESSLLSSTVNESFLKTSKVDHGLKKPDMMLEIPTQELIDCMDDFDSDSERSDEKAKNFDVSKQISSLEKEIDDNILDSDIEMKHKEIIESSSESTKEIINENVTKERESSKDTIDSKVQGTELVDQHSNDNISNLTEKDVGSYIVKEADSQKGKEIMDQKIAENISETKDQGVENSNDDVIAHEATKNIQDSVSDVEMCDVSEKSEAFLSNTESDKVVVSEEVESTDKLTAILQDNTKGSSNNDSIMEVDENLTPEKEPKSASIYEQPSKDLGEEQTVVCSSPSPSEKSDHDLQISNQETKNQINEVVDMETSKNTQNMTSSSEVKDNQTAMANVLATARKEKDTDITAIIDNTEIRAVTPEKNTLKEDLESKELNVDEKVLTSSKKESPMKSLETVTQEINVEPTSAISDQEYIKKGQLNIQTDVPELEQSSPSVLINESVKLEPKTDSLQDVTTAMPKSIENNISTLEETTMPKDPSNLKLTTLKLEPVSYEQESKDLVDDISIKSAKPTSNKEYKTQAQDPITTVEISEDPVLDLPSTESISKAASNVDPTTPVLDPVNSESKNSVDHPSTSKAPVIQTQDPITTEDISKTSILGQTLTQSTLKVAFNVEPMPILDPVNSASKDQIDQSSTSAETSSKDPSNIKPITPILDPVNSDSKDPVDQPSTSKATEKQMDQIPDTTDEVPEMEDTLGLLAESSRVVDADAEEGSSEGGEAEEDEDGDDDDFDPDDESSNQMTAEHSEESNAQPEKEDGQTEKGDETPVQEKQFNFGITAGATAKNGAEMEVTKEASKAIDDVTASKETISEAAETGSEFEGISKETPAQQDLTEDSTTVGLSEITDKETEAATNSILKELLSKQGLLPPDMLRKRTKLSADGVVDIESSSEDDEANKKKTAQQADKEKEAATAQKGKPTSEETANTPEQNDALPVDETVTTRSAKKNTTADSQVFNLDSDDDDVQQLDKDIIIEDKTESNKCINPSCPSGARATYVLADAAARAYFDANKKKKYRVCVACAESVAERTKGLVNGIKEFTPLLELDLRKVSSETVEISDSDSDNDDTEAVQADILGEGGAKFLEEHLADVINETWLKYKLDERLGDAQSELDKQLQKLEAESKEIDTMLNECQVATDLLRNQLYATFEPERRELTAINIMDTPTEKYSYSETAPQAPASDNNRLKRKCATTVDQPVKRFAAIPLGYTPIETGDSKTTADPSNIDDDKDISVVKLSAESAPSDLPPPGEIVRQPLRAGMAVYAMRNSFCTWLPGKIVDLQPKVSGNAFTVCRVRFEIRQKIATRLLAARCLAYIQPAEVRLTIGTRVIALSQENAKSDEPAKKKSFYSGIVAEIPNPVNSYRYLIFFDHGYAQYVAHRDTRVVCESANLVWEEVHPNSREFVKQYLLAYPERPMVRLHAGQTLKTEWNGKWWVTKVLQVDASLVEVSFEDNRSEWIYRGSTRLAPLFLELQAAERQRARPLPRSNQRRMNMPYVEYTRSEEQNKAEAIAAAEKARQDQHNEELRRQRAVAKKSTALPANTQPAQTPPAHNLDSVTSRVVYYTPKNAVKPLKMSPHTCSAKCKRSDVLALKDLRTYNPLAKPLLSGWERQIVRFKGHKEVMYRAPCGRRLRNMKELHRYLRAIQSDMGVDLFDFGANTHCLAEFVLNKCLVGKKDLSHGKENVPVPCVNYYDESLPEFCSYNTERTPTAGVPLNLDPDFLCGCDCTDDCQDKTKCACWKMTLEGARTIGLQGSNIGYEYKRLPEPLPSGIYECNSRCKCKQTCLNRVAQHPLQLKLQVFKTMNRGWGIRALNDVPKGSFLCVYAGNLLTDATANLDGLNEGDEYLAELDYIEVVEQMKEGYEEDIPEADKKLDRESSKSASEEEEPSSEEEDNSSDKQDGDFEPGYIGMGLTEFNKRLRKRDRRKKDAEKQKGKEQKGKEIDKGMEDDGCITISDDEEAKEPAQFTAQTGIGANEFVPKYKSVRTLFGKDEACYIMDAKVQGNIGRYLNHSCTPNVFVQNVFVDTHDPRFPWVAFFALSHIRAGTELTWNYNYDVGSVPGKVLYCYCGAPNCRGRLL